MVNFCCTPNLFSLQVNIKNEQTIVFYLVIPDFFELMSITSLYKQKGLKSEISNERRIFNVSKVRSILTRSFILTFMTKLMRI